MNWYKISQQQEAQEHMGFYDETVSEPTPVNEFYQKSPKTTEYLKQVIEDNNSVQDILKDFKRFGFKWEQIKFLEETIIKVYTDDNIYIIPDSDYPELKDPENWLVSLGSNDLYYYMEPSDFGQDFWKDITIEDVVYHGTYSDNIPIIKKEGLKPKNKTRGLSNRSTSAAIFTSTDPSQSSTYGDALIEINVGRMKRDGYTPNVSKEEPIEEAMLKQEMARKLGFEIDFVTEYLSEGIWEATVIFYDTIPPKYLSLSENK